MKNFRKIVAILAAVLMLFSVLPMTAMASDVVKSMDFEDGTANGWQSDCGVEVVDIDGDKALKWDSSLLPWANMFNYNAGISANTDYVLTMDVKADRETNMNLKVLMGDWSADAFRTIFDVSTEWQNVTVEFNTGDGNLLMLSSNAEAGAGATYYVDNIVIAIPSNEPEAPELEVGVVANGNFENGAEGWTLNGTASVENGALKIDNCSQWAEAAMADVAVEVGTEYTLSWKSQRVSGGNGAFLMFVLKGSDSSNHPLDGQNWMNSTSTDWIEHSLKFTAEEALLKLKLSADADAPGVILIDDIKLTATPKAEVGKITNGDFETGDLTGWTKWQSTDISADAAHTGSYGVNIIGNGGWGGMLDQHISIEDGKTYELSFWFKVNNSGFNWSLKGDQSGASYGSGWMQTQTWTQVTKTFVANGDTSVFLNFNGGNTGVTESAYIDDVMIKELKDPSDDGFIKNGDFETGKDAPWTLYSGTAVAAEAAKNGNYGLYIKNPTGGWGGTAFQDFSVEIGKSYEVTMWAKNLAGSRGQNIQILNGGATVASKWFDNTFEWTLLTFEFTATATNSRINICGGGTYANEEIYVDDIKVVELKQPSFDGYITNGDFETGETFPWENLWGSCPTVEIVEGGKDSAYALNIVSGKWKHVRQTNIAVTPNTWYKVTAWAKNASDMCLLVKDGGDSANLAIAGVNAGDEWTEFTAVFNSGDYSTILFSLMGGENDEIAEKYGTFDNISIEITEAPCEHEYFSPCDQHCMICGELTNPDASHNVAHVEAIAPTCTAMGNMEYWFCDVCGAAWLDAECTLSTNLRAVKLPAAGHQYDDCSDLECNVCGEAREFGHSLTYTPAKDAIDCANPGNVENWYCSECGEYFADAECTTAIAPWFIQITVDCVRPEGIADCATVACETCGNDIYGYGEHDVLICQGGTCSKCNAEIEGAGCQNYDSPACEDGVCYYCGGFVAGFGHENGAWAACCDGECAYGCGLTYPATEDHVDEDADDYCDNCWNHLACADEDGDGFCDVCWSEMPSEPPVEIVYGDCDGDGEITMLDSALMSQYLSEWDVELDMAAADVDGDGEVTMLDSALLSQYLSEWDVTLGPVDNPLFNDAELGGW